MDFLVALSIIPGKTVEVPSMKHIIVTAIALLLLASQALAVTMNFAGPFFGVCPIEFCHGTYVENGIRMQSTAGHYDILSPGAGGTGAYVNVDIGSLNSDNSNGPISTVRFDLFGGSFNLLSLYVVETGGTLSSSAGGTMLLSITGPQNFSGPSWTNVAWVDFSSTDGFTGIDNFQVTAVAEPSVAWLLLIGSLVFAWVRSNR
jgi:hypothetical protein